MEFRHKFVYRQQKSISQFKQFELIISNIVKKNNYFLSYNKISLIKGILLIGVLISNLLNSVLASWLLMNLNFFFPQTAHFDTSIKVFCLAFLTLEFLFAVFFSKLAQYSSIIFIWSQIIWYNGMNLFAILIYCHELLIIVLFQ